jgi:DNA topoisomerase-1
MAVGLLALPRLLGEHPQTGAKIKASLGRFGPYVVHDQGKEGKDYRSLKATDDVLTISLERALELFAEPKKGRSSSSSKSKAALRELGTHPDDDAPVNIYEGPYGHYIKHGKTNVGLPEGKTVENITLSDALELLQAKASTKSTRKTTSKTTSKTSKTTTSKTKATTTKSSTSSSKKKEASN